MPAKYPIRANREMYLRYHEKVIFSIPITTTPAAEPIINMLPPTPAQYAKSCQNAPS